MLLFNGAFVNEKSVSISYQDRGYHFGDGVYEVFRVYESKIYEKQAHLARLERSAREISLPLPYSITQIGGMLEKLIHFNQLQTGTLYVQITRGPAPRNHLFPERSNPTLLAFTTPAARPMQRLENGISTLTVPDIRWLRCDIKSLNLLPNTLAKQKAADHQCDEAILHRDGIVTECSASNVMIVKDGIIRTHPATELILHGITRQVTLRLAKELTIPFQEKAFTLEEMYAADEVFITGTTVEIMPVITIDKRTIGDGIPGPITRKLQQSFSETIPKS